MKIGVTLSLWMISMNLDAATPSNIEQLAQDILQTKAKMLEHEVASRKAMGALYSIDKKIEKLSKKRSDINKKKWSAQSSAERTAMEMVELENKSKSLGQMLNKRLSALYKFSGLGFLRLIFSQASASDLDRNIYYLKKVLAQDVISISEYKNQVIQLQKKRQKLQENVLRLAANEKALQSSELELESEQKVKASYINDLRAKNKFYVGKLQKFRNMTKNIDQSQLSQEVFNEIMTSMFERKGKLSMPVNGRVTRKFGMAEDPEYRFKINNKGIFISTEGLDLVRAVHEGRVVYSDEIDYFGKTVVIDHGDQYFSVYSNFNEVFVKSGDSVDTARELGRLGSMPTDMGRGLYFEIRHFSDALNPMPWFEDRRLATKDERKVGT